MQEDIYWFTKPGYPFIQISYDCVTMENNYSFIKDHPTLVELLATVSEGVGKLNIYKNKKGNSVYRQLNRFLLMKESRLDETLNRINWEFLVYPELFNKNLKN